MLSCHELTGVPSGVVDDEMSLISAFASRADQAGPLCLPRLFLPLLLFALDDECWFVGLFCTPATLLKVGGDRSCDCARNEFVFVKMVRARIDKMELLVCNAYGSNLVRVHTCQRAEAAPLPAASKPKSISSRDGAFLWANRARRCRRRDTLRSQSSSCRSVHRSTNQPTQVPQVSLL
jgi:hypothetical protein